MRALFSLAMLTVIGIASIGCSGSPPRTTTQATATMAPTPNLQATVDAAVNATFDAIAKPLDPRPDQPASTVATVPAKSGGEIRLEAVDFNSYTSQMNYTYIQGFIVNHGSTSAAGIEVAVSLIGDGNATVGAAQAHIKPSMLKGGARSPWLAQIQGMPQFREIRVQVQGQPMTGRIFMAPTQDFRIDGVAVRPPGNQFSAPTISGQVVNTGTKTAALVEITAAIYGPDGKLYQVARTFAKLQEIAPGQSAPFELDPLGRNLREISKYDLYVEGTQRE